MGSAEREANNRGTIMANSKHVGHFYAPIAYFNGTVLKYHGIATEENQNWVVEKTPGTIILPEFNGDRINAADHSEYRG